MVSDKYRISVWGSGIICNTTGEYVELDEVVELLNKLNDKKSLAGKKVLLVEDGSVDVEKLEKDGFYCIVYRQGAKPPILMKE